MTWVLGWPLYDDDAIEIAKKLNLVKDPNAGEAKYIDAARSWIIDRAKVIQLFSCWVGRLGSMPQLVISAYVEFGDKPTPPTDAELDRDYLMSKKQYRHLKSLMPLRDFAWYQHVDSSCRLYTTTEWVYDDEEEEGEEADEGNDDSKYEGDTETEEEEEVVEDDGASDWEDEDDGDSDVETVRAGARKRSSA
ncbi:hypothetical protein FOMPIDRAFT_1023616 [Fomitopsis schrenkii]|uniref:Uncharacterized protein n=1 Tax=Fomitopsis schrenkii TaxID=2126942 RepID=S8E7G7_FOMSC|nr:hypothetical protein FOMPIDRAFT_1023616 [Fomitopsis schrenkii]